MPVKILIADDEPNQLELLSYNLVQAGFDVAQAYDGQAAMTMIEDSHPDLVVLDWMMPHMSGIELCRILRSRADTKLLPIIILSARGEEGDRTLDELRRRACGEAVALADGADRLDHALPRGIGRLVE